MTCQQIISEMHRIYPNGLRELYRISSPNVWHVLARATIVYLCMIENRHIHTYRCTHILFYPGQILASKADVFAEFCVFRKFVIYRFLSASKRVVRKGYKFYVLSEFNGLLCHLCGIGYFCTRQILLDQVFRLLTPVYSLRI